MTRSVQENVIRCVCGLIVLQDIVRIVGWQKVKILWFARLFDNDFLLCIEYVWTTVLPEVGVFAVFTIKDLVME